MKHASLLLFFAIILAYGGFVFSSYGFLIKSEQSGNKLLGQLECSYFTGISVVKKTYLYNSDNLLGRSQCPRTIYFGEPDAQAQ